MAFLGSRETDAVLLGVAASLDTETDPSHASKRQRASGDELDEGALEAVEAVEEEEKLLYGDTVAALGADKTG